jgi:hypothetical protein
MPGGDAGDDELQSFVESILAAGLAPQYLSYLENERNLSSSERRIKRMIESSPDWKDKIEDLEYIDRTAKKALSRAYLYNPDELKSELDLRFDEAESMDYVALMDQLHRHYGSNMRSSDFRTLADVVGESGARSIRAILRDYMIWRYYVNAR